MSSDAFHLPRNIDTLDHIVLERAGERALAPRLTPDDVRSISAQLLAARAELVRLPVARIIDAIAEAARRLRDPRAGGYADLIRGVAAFTGYSLAMAEHVLERMSADWLVQPLEQLIRDELGGTDAIDSFITRASGTRSRAIAPPLTLHVFSGNVPGVSVTSIVRALLIKSAVLGKTAAGEPLLAPRFARVLADVDPVVGACVAVTYWSGGDALLESAALECVDAVIHYGSAAAIDSLRARAPANVRFIEHGPRLSFAIINGAIVHDAAGAQAAIDLARAVALFDQQGCVSPQAVYVVGGDARAAQQWAARVATALAALQLELPRGRIDAAEAAAVRELRTQAEFRSIRGEPLALWSGENLAWTVVFDPAPEFSGSCLNRTLIVKHAASLDDVIARIRPFRYLLQTIGVAGYSAVQLRALAAAAADAGATRIASIANMPWPPISWHHDGRGPLTELIRWADLES